ncbi:MAG: amylo-alpha-1,6-glucosidase [Thermoplasmata archaeon]|nr:amylo-alpha-1,6-glucosidase [Thermoplasmata archaeon]
MRYVLSQGHLFAVVEEDISLYAYDTLFLENLNLKTSPPSRLVDFIALSDKNIRLIYAIGKNVIILRDILLEDGYREKLLFFNRRERPIKIKLGYAYSMPFQDIMENDYPQFSIKRNIVKMGGEFIYRGLDGNSRILQMKIPRGEVEIPPKNKVEEEFRAIPGIKGDFKLSTFRKSEFEIKSCYSSKREEVYRMAIRDLKKLLVKVEDSLFPIAGLPDFGAIFGRDSLWTALFLLDRHPQLAKGVLTILSRLQGKKCNGKNEEEAGKIPHEYRFGELVQAGVIPFNPYYGSVDTTPLYVILAGEYLSRSGDKKLIKALRENITGAVEWILHRLEDGGGYIRYGKGTVLENQCWKDWKKSVVDERGEQVKHPVAVVEVQGYAYWALKLAAEYELTDIDENALKKEAEKLRVRFNRDFWMGSHYALALDGENRPSRVVASNMGHLLLTGIATHEKETAERLFQRDIKTKWGIRTLSERERAYDPFSYHNGSIWPHDNAIIAMGLTKIGEIEKARELAQGLIDAFFLMGRIPELFSGLDELSPLPYANNPQAWSAAGAIKLLQISEGGMKNEIS